MKKFVCLTLFLLVLTPCSFAGNINSDCTFKGKKLYGNVRVVDNFADFKVKITDSFPDLKVRKVNSFADNCGKWRFTDSFSDFTVQFVDSFEDFKIKFVDSFEGL